MREKRSTAETLRTRRVRRAEIRQYLISVALVGTKKEFESLMLQFATSKRGRGGPRKLPLVFTEHGAIMAANVLNSERAVWASVEVVRAFVHLRRILASNSELARKLDELEQKYDRQFKVVFDALRELMARPTSKRKQIGFNVKR